MPSRIVALDYGRARVGLAISDPMGMIAAPAGNIDVKKKKPSVEVAKALERLCEEKKCTLRCVVIGMPLMLNGTSGTQAQEVKTFARELEEHIDCPIEFIDERMTTLIADKALQEGNLSRKKRAQSVDSVAASLILQSYLEKL